MNHEKLVKELVEIIDIHKDQLRRCRRMLEIFDLNSPHQDARAKEEDAIAKRENLLFEHHETHSLDNRSKRFIEKMVEVGIITEFPPPQLWTPPCLTATMALNGPEKKVFLKAYPDQLSKSLIYLSQFQTDLAAFEYTSESAKSTGSVYQTIIGNAGIVAAGGGIIGDIVNSGSIGAVQSGKLDPAELARELSALWSALRKEARSDDISADIDIGKVAEAAKKASEGDAEKAINALGKVGAWVLETARKIGVPIAVAAITAAMGVG